MAGRQDGYRARRLVWAFRQERMATVWMKRYRQVRSNCLEGRSNRTWD